VADLKFSLEEYKCYLSPALAKTTNLMIESGKGCYIKTTDGEEYMDFVQGIAVNALGHSHPKVVAAAKEQIEKIFTASFNLVYYPTTVELARRIAEIAPGDLNSVFFSNGGAEANDGALKLARNYTGRPGIIAFRGSFHGRTMGATSITASNAKYRKNYEPLLPSVYFAPYPTCSRCPYNTCEEKCALECIEEINRLFQYLVTPDNVAAMIIEPVMGEGGYIVPPKKYMQALRKICDEHGILLIFDEIQSGYGRTGKMFASENFGVVPDIMTLGKAIAGGLPMSAIVSTKEIMSKWLPGSHGTTFGGNPVCAATALAVLDVFEEEKILDKCNEQGKYLKDKLLALKEKYPVIGDVRGLGLMLAIELVKEDNSPNGEAFKFIRQYCEDHKLLILGCGYYGNNVRFATPLNITKEEIDKGLAIIEDALKNLK
jgi:4-aminobutyrate aminotransferase